MEDRVDAIVAELALDDKIRLLSGRDIWHLEAIPDAGISPIMMTDGPHGIRKQELGEDRVGIVEAVPSTCFPPAVTLASSWDETLLTEIGSALGEEAGSLGVGVVLGPGMNLKRHPNGGRNFEYLSEDPLLSGKLAAALVRGIQSTGVGACVKHFAVNNQETRRLVVDAVVDERTLRELYLTGFEIAVAEGKPWTVMAAYNRLNGTYCTEDPALLTALLRDEWGFNGLVMTDWGATSDRVAGIEAGLDLEMPGGGSAFDAEVKEAVVRGDLQEASIDRAVRRVVSLQLRAAQTEPADGFDADRHHALATRAAAAGTVLLSNDGVLPLNTSSSVAVVGAFATEPRYQGAGSSRVNPTRLETALDAFSARFSSVVYAGAYDPQDGTITPAGLRDAALAAADADVAVVFAGLPDRYESEGFDRDHLRLPDAHSQLIDVVTAVNDRTVVVLSNGGPVEMPWVERPAAIVEAYLGGQAGGSAIVKVLIGEEEPGGRLAETFPIRQSDVAADTNFPGEGRQVQYREGLFVGYRYFDTAGVGVRFPFGHGLSYTTFDLLSPTVAPSGDGYDVTVTVQNTGDRSGTQVVQIYVRDVESTAYRPDKELRGFAKVRLAPGETATPRVHLDRRAFAFFDPPSGEWQVEAGVFEILVGTSSVDIIHTLPISIPSEFAPDPQPGPSGFVATDDEFAAMLGHPIPDPNPTRPFTRNSTVEDLGATRFGRQVRRALLAGIRRQIAGMVPAENDSMRRMLEATMREAPLRSIVLFSGGKVSFAALDSLLDLLNGHWATLGKRVGRRGHIDRPINTR